MSLKMWIMKITPGGSGNTKKYFENLFINDNAKNLIGYSKDGGKIEEFSNRWKKIEIGDLIIVIEGFNRVYGVVEVTSGLLPDGTLTDDDSDWFIHRRKAELIKFFNPYHETKARTNQDTIIEYSGDGAVDICDEIWELIKEDYYNIKTKKTMNELQIILEAKKQLILQGPPGTGKTYTAKDLAEHMLFGLVSPLKSVQKSNLESSNQFKLVQFHPSYTYEDFVRGIVARANGTQIEYITENKILAKFAKEAKLNYDQSLLAPQVNSARHWFENKLNQFIDTVELSIINNGEFRLNETVFINEIVPGGFKYTGRNVNTQLIWSTPPRTMRFEDVIEGCLNNVRSRQEYIGLNTISGLAIQHASYFYRMVELFRDSITEPVPNFADGEAVPLKKYVLIIDEINRANLPSVLGELIYALEYRGESVNSMYDIEGDYSIIIPSNLYIIGTMNTADRSVGHIDYAIKRRFAFKNICANENVITNFRAKELFKKVSALFTEEYLASDFDRDDVQLGHSYFIVQSDAELKLKLKFEIVPILKEYVKDGLLKKNSETILEEITNFAI